MQMDVFQYIPLTFHIQSGLEDPQYQRFLQHWSEQQSIWILKPGELTNRGNGIHVCDNLRQIAQLISRKSTHGNGKALTHILQVYIQQPLLYNKRKFDIRCFMLITTINGYMRAYWYEEGYIRTSSSEYNLRDTGSHIHLTNDAIQKQGDDYGKYEIGNKLSFLELQRYLELWYPNEKYDFFKDVYPKLKYIATQSVRAVYNKIDPNKREHNFEVFGLDFMIDHKLHPWLIEINTNPCLELSSPLLARLIPQMLENAFRYITHSFIAIDYQSTQSTRLQPVHFGMAPRNTSYSTITSLIVIGSRSYSMNASMDISYNHSYHKSSTNSSMTPMRSINLKQINSE